MQLASRIRLALALLGLNLPLAAQVDIGLALAFPQAKNPAVVEEKSSVGLQAGARFLESGFLQGRVHAGWIGLNSKAFEAKTDRMYIDSNVFFVGVDGSKWVTNGVIGLVAGLEARFSYRSLMSAPLYGRRKGSFISSERALDLAPSLGIRVRLSSGSNPLELEAMYLRPLVLKRFDHNGLDPPSTELRFSMFVLF